MCVARPLPCLLGRHDKPSRLFELLKREQQCLVFNLATREVVFRRSIAVVLSACNIPIASQRLVTVLWQNRVHSRPSPDAPPSSLLLRTTFRIRGPTPS